MTSYASNDVKHALRNFMSSRIRFSNSIKNLRDFFKNIPFRKHEIISFDFTEKSLFIGKYKGIHSKPGEGVLRDPV